MSTSVLSMPYTEKSGGLTSAGSSPPTPVVVPDTATLVLPPSSLKHASGDRPRLLGVPESGLKISFASDTTFVEGKLRSRGGKKSKTASLNLRPLEGGEKAASVRIKLPKATNSMGSRQIPLLAPTPREDLMHPRRALDIARSYGVPKYFLRGNSQVLTDGRMRLFADNVWKKERTSPPQDGDRGGDSRMETSDVIHRLMDSVDKAIATSERPQQDFTSAASLSEPGGAAVSGIRMDGAGRGKSGRGSERERSALRESFVNLPDVLPKVVVKEFREGAGQANEPTMQHESQSLTIHDIEKSTEYEKTGDAHSGEANLSTQAGEQKVGDDAEKKDERTNKIVANAIRPHTVDAPVVPVYLPRVSHFRDAPGHMAQREEDPDQEESSKDRSSSYAQWFAQQRNDGIGGGGLSSSLSSQMSGIRLRQLASTLRGMSGASQNNQNAMFYNNGGAMPGQGANSINNRVGVLFGGKYSNVLPRFYPAVSAHHVRQREAASRLGTPGGVRFTTVAAASSNNRGVARDSSPSHHPPRRLVRFADTTHTVCFSREAVVASSAAPAATFSSRRKEPMGGACILVASRAPVQSVQRSLDSHSGLTRHEMPRGGRYHKGVSAVRRSLDSTVHTLPAAKKTFNPEPLELFSTLDPETATSGAEVGVETTIHKDKEE